MVVKGLIPQDSERGSGHGIRSEPTGKLKALSPPLQHQCALEV